MQQHSSTSGAVRFFNAVVRFPKTVLISGVLLLFCWAILALPSLQRDTRADAFLASDNPALVYKDKVKAQFGLSDPMVIAVVNNSSTGIFNPQSLRLVQWLSDEIQQLQNVDPDKVVSLATQNNITGTAEGMQIEPFFDPLPISQLQAEALRRSVNDFPLYLGSIVADSGQATLIVAELIDDQLAAETFQQIEDIIQRAEKSPDDSLHLAGEGAVSGFLGEYIDRDAVRLNPLAGLIITLIVCFAFRRLLPALLGNLVIAASVLITLSVMSAVAVPFYIITNAMPVILIGISVADAIHIFSEYYQRQAQHPEHSVKGLIVQSMAEMWRPITLTTATTIAGFLGLYFSAYMPPFQYFGLFTALGVAIAWFYSLFVLPAAIVLFKPTVHPAFIRAQRTNKGDIFSRAMAALGGVSIKYARTTISVAVVMAVLGLISASALQVDEDRIATFHPSEPIFQADQVINQYLDGSNNLDIVIESDVVEGLFEIDNLRQIEALQRFAETLAHVNGSTSVVDYLKQMHRSLNDGRADAYQLPDNSQLIAQYFLLYSASADPSDFEEEIDYDYRIANLRLNLDSGAYSDIAPVVIALQQYIDQHFSTAQLTAKLSGRVNVHYHWIKDLGNSHFVGLAVSLTLVLLISAWLFQSLVAGLLALLPVVSSLLLVYTAMVLLDIKLGIGTSMFASVAIGLGVDFAIHTIDRLQSNFKQLGERGDAAILALYPSTGRALLFNFLAVCCGFGVLMSSQVVPLTNFGIIVVISVSTSFLTSLTLLPALVKVIKPRFIYAAEDISLQSAKA